MRKKLEKKMKLNRETLRQLAGEPLEGVVAGVTVVGTSCSPSCMTVCTRCPTYCCP